MKTVRPLNETDYSLGGTRTPVVDYRLDMGYKRLYSPKYSGLQQHPRSGPGPQQSSDQPAAGSPGAVWRPRRQLPIARRIPKLQALLSYFAAAVHHAGCEPER